MLGAAEKRLKGREGRKRSKEGGKKDYNPAFLSRLTATASALAGP